MRGQEQVCVLGGEGVLRSVRLSGETSLKRSHVSKTRGRKETAIQTADGLLLGRGTTGARVRGTVLLAGRRGRKDRGGKQRRKGKGEVRGGGRRRQGGHAGPEGPSQIPASQQSSELSL